MGKILIPLLTAATMVAAMAYQARSVDPVLCAAPDVVLPEVAGYVSQAEAVSETERTVLPADTQIVRRSYADDRGERHLVTAVIGGRSKSSVHRPELCLPAQGFQMYDPQRRDVSGVEWRFISLVQKNGQPQGFAYTFFNQAGYRTSSHLKRIWRDVWDRSVLCRIDRWVMITVFSSVSDRQRQAAFLDLLKGAVR